METQEPTKQQNKDWRKQGLGWIPDYPDQRDLTLNNLQDELQENSLNSPIENITSNLLDLIRVLKNPIQENDIPALEALETKIEKQISDRQIFPEFKAYKRLQSGEKSEEVVQLKHYFNLLNSYNNTLKDFFTLSDYFKLPEESKEYFEWLDKNDFDDKLKKIVSAFQQKVKIEQDGIVGLKTYTAIENYLSDPNYSGNIDNNQLALVSFLPLFSESVITVIFQTLDSWQRIQNLSNKEEIKTETEIKTVFIDIFKDQFYVIEPITSVVGSMMLPLATSNSIEKVLKNSLDRFLNLFDDKINPSQTTISLAIQAIQEVHKNLNQEIEDLHSKETSEKPLETKEKDRLKFYNFLLPIIDKLDGMAKKLPLPQLPDSQSPKLPQRKYFLEIMIKNNSSDKEWIKPDKFNLPVTRTWYDKFLKLTNDQAKPNAQAKPLRYYCFLPRFVDLSFWCSPVRNQGSINSCAAFAGVALIEYFYKKNLGQLSQLSPLFLYKITRNLMGVQGDVGASVRSIMKAMLAIGVLKEQYWSYQEDKFDEEPPAFCYSVAQNNKILKYFRIDNPKISSDMLLFRIQAVLAVGTPCIFGFTVYSSFYRNDSKQGCIPFPSKQDIVVGGHTVVAVGYDDFKEIDYADGTNKSTGALLIRNSWGEDWGQSGYGWLPYDFVLKGLSADWWSLLQVEWLNVENVGFKRMVLGSVDPLGEDQPHNH